MTNNATSYDVREALAHILWEAAVGDNPEGVPGESWEELLAEEPVWAQGYYFQADAAMRAFEVLPRGTVPAEQISDAEVEAAREQAKWAHLSLFGNDGPTDEKWDRILHAALKAAWGVRNAAH